MNKKGQESVIISFFIAAMVALIIVVVAGDFVTDQNTLVGVVNETITTINGTFVSLANPDLVSGTFNMENQSLIQVPTTSYILDLVNGRVQVNNSIYAFTNQVNYTYFPAGYTKSNLNRSLVLLVPVFIIIALILFLVVPLVFKES